nr:ADP,ATP carrier protein 1, mitochondrial [Tanacetum cinerariifolium]
MNQKHPTLNKKLGRVYFGTVPKVCVQAPLENWEHSSSKKGIDLFLAGLYAAVGKTAVAPIERVKLLIQNQDGASSLLFLYPLEYARTRLATDLKVVDLMFGDRKFKNWKALYMRTLESDGIAGLYHGFGPSCVGIALYRSLYFGLYESLKPVVLTGKLKDNTSASFALASGVSFIAGLTSYPLDTASQRMMITSTEAFEFKHSWHALNYIMKKEGAKSHYKGASVNILCAIAGGGVLLCFDKLEFNLYPLSI